MSNWFFQKAPAAGASDFTDITGCVYYLDPNNSGSVTLSGSDITQINNLGSAGGHVSGLAAHYATLVSSVINARSIARFVSSPWAFSSTAWMDYANAYTFVPIWKHTAVDGVHGTQGNNIFVMPPNNGHPSTFFWHPNGTIGILEFGGSHTGSLTFDSTFHKGILTHDGAGTHTLTIDGSTVSLSATGADWADGPAIGAPSSSSTDNRYSFFGDLAAFVVYDHVLSGGEITTLNSIISARFGL